MNLSQVATILKNTPETNLDQVLTALKDFINIKDCYGTTLLIWASYSSFEPLALKLVEKGANINSKDRNNNTPLIWASCNKLESLTAKLIEKGADIDVRDGFNKTAIDYIKEKWSKDAKTKILDLIKLKNPPATITDAIIPPIISVAQPEAKSDKYPFNLELANCLSKNKIPYKVVDEFIIF